MMMSALDQDSEPTETMSSRISGHNSNSRQDSTIRLQILAQLDSTKEHTA